jgi:hypothetical protein
MSILYVKKDGSGNSTTIQGAIQAAQVGDTVEIEAGTFDENIDLWKGITLKGAGMSQTIITGSVRSAITSKTFTWSLGSTTLTISAGNNTDQYEIGRIVSATGIPANSRLVSKTSTTLTISAATTQAVTTARAVAMALQNDASMRVRGTNGVIRDMKVVGFDHPNPAVEYAAIYFRNTGLGSVAAFGWEMLNCEVEANGEYGLLTDYAAGVGSLNIHDCKFSGKSFAGSNPATGNQFSVFNVPRQLVTVQSVNAGSNFFVNNQIIGSTGGLTVDGVASFNTAVTFDPANSVVTGNVVNGTHGYGYALRCRGAGSTVENNKNYSLPSNPNAGFLIGPTGAQTSALNIGTNLSILALLVTSSQSAPNQPVAVSLEKNQLKSISKVSQDAEFSDDSSWVLVSCIFKHDGSSKRLVSGFRDLSSQKEMKLRSNMLNGEKYDLHKIIISKQDRELMVLNRSDIEDASTFDITISKT